MFGVAENTKRFLVNSKNKWKLELTSNGVSLGNVEIRRGIFQGDSLSPLLFVPCMVPSSLIFTDDVKLFAKSHDQIDSLVNTIYTFSENIRMEFGIKKRGLIVLKQGKGDKTKSKGLNLQNGKIMKRIYEEGCKYLGILEHDKVKDEEMKTEFVREYKRRISLILTFTLNGKNKILDRKTWRLLTMHKGLQSKSDVDILYVSRKEGGRGLMSCESTTRSDENNTGLDLKNSDENLLQRVNVLEF